MTTDNKVPHFEWSFGPAFFGLMLQTVIGIIAVVFLYGQQVATNENTRNTTQKLELILDKATGRADGMNDRLIKLETIMDGMNSTVKSMDKRLSQVPIHQP